MYQTNMDTVKFHNELQKSAILAKT